MQSPSAPQAPNATQVAKDQTTSNVNTAVANATLGNTNQVTPYGNLTYTQTGGQDVGGNFVPSYTATQTLSPEQQQIYDKTTGLQSGALDTASTALGQVNNSINKPLDFSAAPALPGSQDKLREDAYNALTQRSNIDLNRSEGAQKNLLANQGIAAGSEAYNRALDPIERARVDASGQATINAGTIAGQNLSEAQTLRNQYINEAQTVRNQPIQDLTALLGFGGGVKQPTYAPGSAGQVAPTDTASPVYNSYNGQLQQYQAQTGANNALLGGLFGLGGSAAGAAGMFAL